MEFCGKIKKLNGEQLTKFVGFVQAQMKSSVSEVEGDKVQIVVDDWPRPFFDEFNNFVTNMIESGNPNKRQKVD